MKADWLILTLPHAIDSHSLEEFRLAGEFERKTR
jgi:hypothetical protein